MRNYYTEEEIVLCSYIAMYGANKITYEDVGSIHNRSLSSIKLKVQNIVSMLDEEGIERFSDFIGLSGVTTGKSGRRTNWNTIEKYIKFKKQEFLDKCQKILNK